jgi:hypothetical protein
MFERFKRGSDQHETTARGGSTAVADRPTTRTNGTTEHTTRTGRLDDREHMKTVRARQREEFGGINWGAAFFGWLVAIGVSALLVGILAAAGTAVGLTTLSESDATSNASDIGLGGAIALLAALAIAYYCGGYVAGRMSRFDGARQGLGAWLIGLFVTILLAVAGIVLGEEYNVLEQLNLPALPVGESELLGGAAITLVAVIVGTLLAAIVGGKAGERYHRKVDRAGFPG